MLLKLALKNLKARKLRNALAAFSIAIGTAALLTFASLSSGIETASFKEIESHTSLNQITVRPNLEKSGLISFLSQSKEGQLSNDSVEKISEIPGVKTIYKEIQYKNFASVKASIFGLVLRTDSMIFGLPAEFLDQDQAQWDKLEEPYPALIPRKFLDLYNFTIASPQNLPKFSEDQLIGKELTLYLNHSTFFPSANEEVMSIKLKVLGFSDKINLIGLTLPYEVVEKFNQEKAENYVELYVETTDQSQVSEIAAKIEKMGYNTKYLQKDFKNVEAKFIYIKAALSIISLIILITSIIAILSTFLATISERKREIGLLRAIGASKAQIRKLILTEAAVIGFVGSTFGVVISLLATKIMDNLALKELSATTFAPDSLFNTSPNLIIFTLLFGTSISLLAAYFPAQQASKLDPIKALKA